MAIQDGGDEVDLVPPFAVPAGDDHVEAESLEVGQLPRPDPIDQLGQRETLECGASGLRGVTDRPDPKLRRPSAITLVTDFYHRDVITLPGGYGEGPAPCLKRPSD